MSLLTTGGWLVTLLGGWVLFLSFTVGAGKGVSEAVTGVGLVVSAELTGGMSVVVVVMVAVEGVRSLVARGMSVSAADGVGLSSALGGAVVVVVVVV
jgi:hypothetical protein